MAEKAILLAEEWLEMRMQIRAIFHRACEERLARKAALLHFQEMERAIEDED